MSSVFHLPNYKGRCPYRGALTNPACNKETEAVIFWTAKSRRPQVYFRCPNGHGTPAGFVQARRLTEEERAHQAQKALQGLQDNSVPMADRQQFADVFEALTSGMYVGD